MKASIKLSHDLLAVESANRVHAMLELAAPPAQESAERPPLNLALVIDRSGSMAGPKLDHTKAAAKYLIRRLKGTDRLALVCYDDEVTLVSSLQPVDRDLASKLVDSIYPRGSTNLSGGWLKGLEEAGRADSDGPRKVLLLTDGLANQGIIDASALTEMAAQARSNGTGTTTIGFGADFDEQLLTAMAEAGGGNSHYASSPEDAPGIFATEFDDLVRLVGQNVSVEIRPSQHVDVVGILNEFPVVSVAGGLQLQIGDAYADETRRIVFELGIPEIARLGKAKVADVVLRYVTVGDEVAAHEITIPMYVNLVSADEAKDVSPDPDVAEEVLILKSARAQREARELADRGDFDRARKLLRDSAKEIRGFTPYSSRADELIKEAEILEQHAEMAAPMNWDASSAKAMHYDSRRRHQSRRRNEPPQL